jgi:hypothetical protein
VITVPETLASMAPPSVSSVRPVPFPAADVAAVDSGSAAGSNSAVGGGIEVDVWDDDDDIWHVSSDIEDGGWAVLDGYRAEDLVRELVIRQAPELLAEVEFDSYHESFCAYVERCDAAERLAALIRTLGSVEPQTS